jgi:WD40 repeat protein
MYAGTGTSPLFTVNVDQGYGRSKSIAFSPDGLLFVTGGGNGLVQFWETATGHRAGRSVLANACWIDSLEFNTTGRELLASGCDGSARLIDVPTRNAIGAPFQGPGDIHNSAVFSSDYGSIIVAYTDGSMLRWNIDPSSWRARACAVAGRNLTRDEWARFLPERPYGTVCPGLS